MTQTEHKALLQEEHNAKYRIEDNQVLSVHEAKDRAFVAFDMWEDVIQNHTFIADNNELKQKAKDIANLMHDFYMELSQYETKEQQAK